jgi:glycosyltransferase involved in cell wall biosynthesis
MGHCRVDWVADGIRIFHLNGAEMQYALPKIEERQPGFLRRGYNVLAPAWELPRFPAEWAKEFNRFHEIWAPTAYVQGVLQRAVSVPIFRLRNACEPHAATNLDKSCFGIPEDSFAILNFFDLRSGTARKNPWAVIEAFRRLRKARPASNAYLVLKINYPAFDPKVVAKLAGEVAQLRDHAILIDKIMTTNEIRNLVRCCDCFISLHRSEGFGRGPAEAMFFGKPAIATGWSGNMEYMNDKVAFPIRYTLQPVKEGEYPQHEDQVWAEADVAHAAEVLIWLLDDPALRRKIGERGRRHMERQYSDKIVGMSYRRRIEAILDGPGRTFRNINR